MLKRISKKSKITAALLMTVLVVAGSIGATLAYYSNETKVLSNQFTVANIDTDIVEEFKEISETEYTKLVTVKNTGNAPCLVRVRVEVTPSSEEANIKIDDKTVADWKVKLGDDWKYKEDGFFYYTKALPEGVSTASLVNKVNIIDTDKMNDFDIIVYQEAVQTAVYKDSVKGLNQDIIFGDGKTDDVAEIQSIFEAYNLNQN